MKWIVRMAMIVFLSPSFSQGMQCGNLFVTEKKIGWTFKEDLPAKSIQIVDKIYHALQLNFDYKLYKREAIEWKGPRKPKFLDPQVLDFQDYFPLSSEEKNRGEAVLRSFLANFFYISMEQGRRTLIFSKKYQAVLDKLKSTQFLSKGYDSKALIQKHLKGALDLLESIDVQEEVRREKFQHFFYSKKGKVSWPAGGYPFKPDEFVEIMRETLGDSFDIHSVNIRDFSLPYEIEDFLFEIYELGVEQGRRFFIYEDQNLQNLKDQGNLILMLLNRERSVSPADVKAKIEEMVFSARLIQADQPRVQ